MSEKKVVRRSVAIGLGVLCVILAAVIVVGAIYYMQMLNSKDSQIAEARSPKLINVGLLANDLSDEYPWQSIIHVTGYICNTGLDPAYKTKLHVVAYLSTGVAAIDDYFEISGGMLSGREIAEIDLSLPYQGSGITRTTMTPEWSNTP